MDFKERYKVLIDLIILSIVLVAITFIIKFYLKPFFVMVGIFFITSPLFKVLLRTKLNKKIIAAFSILTINIIFLLIFFYLGTSAYDFMTRIYRDNTVIINKCINNISYIYNTISTGAGKSVLEFINNDSIKSKAVTTGDAILAYFIGNVSAFFLLTDKDKVIKLINILIPEERINKLNGQKKVLKKMIIIEIELILLSTFEIIIGFIILKVPTPVTLGVICGIFDILPYIGTIIVFIPIIIYNIIVKEYVRAFGLICLYILVQIIREVLEAKFVGDKLELHPLLVVLSVYVGVKLFGILGIIVGPIYGILAKEIIYNDSN